MTNIKTCNNNQRNYINYLLGEVMGQFGKQCPCQADGKAKEHFTG
jgi:hypothetical protein